MNIYAFILLLCHSPDQPAYLAKLVQQEASRYAMDPGIIVAVMARESSCKVNAIGGNGKDLGLMQLRRGITTQGHDRLSNRQLMRPDINIRLGVRRLAQARRICNGLPEYWLSNYAGLRCGVSEYSRRVMRLVY